MHRMIAMHARPRQAFRADRQTDEHHGNSATIRSIERNNIEKTVLHVK